MENFILKFNSVHRASVKSTASDPNMEHKLQGKTLYVKTDEETVTCYCLCMRSEMGPRHGFEGDEFLPPTVSWGQELDEYPTTMACT